MEASPLRQRGSLRVGPTAAALVAALAGLPSAAATAQDGAVADLRDTVAFALDVHPRPWSYTTEAAVNAALEREAARLAAGPADDVALAGALHRVLALLGDSHLAVAIPARQPGTRLDPFLLPLLPKRAGDAVFVDASEPGFPVGTEILELDGTPIDELYRELADLALVDGDRPEARRARVERDFGLHFHLARGLRGEYAARVRLPDGEERDVVLSAVGRETLGALRARRHSAPVWGAAPTAGPPLPWLETIDDTTWLLRLPAFGVAGQDAYRARVDELFAELEGDETLVLDLRGNPGGLRTNGIAMLEHLLDGPYAQWRSIALRVREIPDVHRSRVAFPFTPPEVLEGFPGERRGDHWVFDGDPLAERMPGAGGKHRGDVVVFIDDATNSAAVEMVAALLSRRPEVRLVGTETIGECGRHVGEIPVMYATPNLGARLLVSLAAIEHVEVRGCQPGHGLVPDVSVAYTSADFLA